MPNETTTSPAEQMETPHEAEAAQAMPANTADIEAMRQIHHLGKLIKKQKGKIAKKEEAVNLVTAERTEAMSVLKKEEHVLEELQDELNKLAAGEQTESLFPPQKAEGEQSPEPQEAAEPEAWRAVRIDELPPPKLTTGRLKILAENKPPLLTLGDMTDWQQQHGEFWYKNLTGFGKTGADQFADACDRYWKANPQAVHIATAEVPKSPTEAQAWDAIPGKPGATEAVGRTLEFSEGHHDNWCAYSLVCADEDVPFEYRIIRNDVGAFLVDDSSGELLPTPIPGPFLTLNEAEVWCQTRESEFAADAHVGTFQISKDSLTKDSFADDATIIPETVEKVIDSELCKIEVSQTVGGRWNCATAGTIGKISFTGAAGMISAPTREEAIAAGADKIHDWLRATMNGGKGTKAMREQSAEILRLLDGLDKSQAQKATA